MKAVRIHEWGNVEVVKLEKIETPTLKEDELLVAVHAAGINPIDWKVREGYFSTFMKDCFPFPMGWDFSGVVVDIRSSTSTYKIGDEVFGLIRFPQPAGTFAEYVAAPIAQVSHKPKKFNHIQAAATPLVSLTAWQALFEYADIQPNQKVLIHAAGGAVGQFAVQFAKYKGAKVIANASNATKELLISYGVDQFIDYKSEKFENLTKDIDVVLDPLGGAHSLRSLSVLKQGGKLIPLLRANEQEITEKAKEKDIHVTFMIVKPNGNQLNEIAHLIDDGLIQIAIEKTFPLEDVKSALNLVQTGHSHGKVVLKIK